MIGMNTGKLNYILPQKKMYILTTIQAMHPQLNRHSEVSKNPAMERNQARTLPSMSTYIPFLHRVPMFDK